jgi:general secretion pathway protein E
MLREIADRRIVERSIAARLLDRGKLEAPALERALRLQVGKDEKLEWLLVKLGFASERDVAEALAEELDLPIAGAHDFPEAPVLEERIGKLFLHQAAVLPLADAPDHVVLAMADPLDDFAIRAIEMVSRKRVAPVIGLPSEIEAAFARLYEPDESALGRIVENAEPGADEAFEEDVGRLRDLASEGPVIRLVSHLITRAVESRASDIHIEPFQNRLAVRYRIDGMLREIDAPPAHLRAAIISRIKIMAKLNIAERRLPQDGRIRVAVHGNDFDLRVATTPTLHGESVVMRVLDRQSLPENLLALGFDEATLSTFLGVVERPQGIVLVTGPTGSGKTTTLYTCLRRLNAPEKKLFTVEDPIEYQLEGVNQVQVRPQIGLTFAQILRSILRQDPDIVMVGEMRDLETAQIAVQASLTGHLVLSTLHTNSAAATVTRLLDMGVNGYLIASTVTGILAQRLVRRLCLDCREPYEVMPELAAELHLHGRGATPAGLYRARGCEACRGTGYFGRVAVTEFLVIDDALRRLVLRHTEVGELNQAAVQQGMVPMYDDGMRKAAAGLTSIDEVLRVTRDI